MSGHPVRNEEVIDVASPIITGWNRCEIFRAQYLSVWDVVHYFPQVLSFFCGNAAAPARVFRNSIAPYQCTWRSEQELDVSCFESFLGGAVNCYEREFQLANFSQDANRFQFRVELQLTDCYGRKQRRLLPLRLVCPSLLSEIPPNLKVM